MKVIPSTDSVFPEILELEDVPVPQPSENELLVRIHAASVNPIDYKIRPGAVPMISREMPPLILGRDRRNRPVDR
jgi:NADPH:quinone reductase-like Zn-dependent oxidoreductase